MIPLLAASAIVLIALAWRFPRHRALIGAALAALIVGAWAWLEFVAEREAPAPAGIPVESLVLDEVAFGPWSGEHRLRGIAHNRSGTHVLTGFDVRIELEDCRDGECRALGTHAQRVNVRVPVDSSAAFERRIRLAPALEAGARGEIRAAEIRVTEVHGRPDLHRAGAPTTREE